MSANYFGPVAQEILNEYDQNPRVPDVLWHYTSSEGLLGIVSTSTLRFAESIYMNDGSEVVHGIELVRWALNEFAAAHANQYAYLVPRIMERMIGVLDQFRSTIFCFCEETNLLNQWRDYGRDVVPYCVGFETKDLADKGEYSFDVYISKVIYDINLQRNILIDAIARMFVAAEKIPGFGSLSDEQAEPYIREAAIEFSQIVLRFKNPAFEAEREWRLIGYKQDIEERVSRKFRPSTLGVIPYYEWSRRRQNSKLPITAVLVGPSPYGRISLVALRELLDQYGYTGVKTDFSTIPIRR